jgi:hypothetical protein
MRFISHGGDAMGTERIGQSSTIQNGYEPPPAATRLMVTGRTLGRAREVADGQVPHDGLEETQELFAAERVFDAVKILDEVGELTHGKGGLMMLPVDAFMMVAHIGQANLDAARANQQRVVVENYADGVAAALDPAYRQAAPADLAERRAWAAGKNLVGKMSPEERKQLAEVLVDARRRETGHRQEARGATYRDGLMGLWEGTVQPRIH